MPLQLQSFLDKSKATLRVFCPSPTAVVATFEDELPAANSIHQISSDPLPDLPARLSWVKPGYDYYAFLPRDRSFDGHLLTPLKYHDLVCTQRDGRWYVDEETRELWQSLDLGLTKSINVIGGNLLVDLNHKEPSRAIEYGFTRGHKSQANLKVSLMASKHAFIHRLAYLTYIIAYRYKWDTPELGDQPWWNEFVARCGPTWVDSVWDAVCRQWDTRNFIGVAVRPIQASVRWLRAALHFGVPIWVLFPQPGCYNGLDGGFVMNQWQPTQEQVSNARTAQKVAQAVALQPKPTPTSPPLDHPSALTPPAILPENGQWFKSWQDFFHKRDEADVRRLEEASMEDRKAWDSRFISAKKFSLPGKGGAKVYTWEECESGGFFRILQTRHEVAQGWEFYYKEALVFNSQANVWDYCPFMWGPAVQGGAPDDADDDDDFAMEHWYTEPELPPNPPDDNPSPLEYLYNRYGYLSVDPTIPAEVILPFSSATAHRIIGLEVQEGTTLKHLNSFISSILQGQLPIGHCDLSLQSPPNEGFPSPARALIHSTVFWSHLPELSAEVVFVFNSNDPRLLVVHDALSVIQLARAGNTLQLATALKYLLHNGSHFTLLHPITQTLNTPKFSIITLPIRNKDWKATLEDYCAYMSRLRTFLLERPHVVVAAFSHGGIAWRIAQEVLGINHSIEAVLGVVPERGSSVDTSRGTYWFHEPDEVEWFYLVGGFELLTGLLVLF